MQIVDPNAKPEERECLYCPSRKTCDGDYCTEKLARLFQSTLLNVDLSRAILAYFGAFWTHFNRPPTKGVFEKTEVPDEWKPETWLAQHIREYVK